MKTMFVATFAALAVAGGAFAQTAGDPAVGEKEFAKCKSCHSITAKDGNTIVKGGKIGPNLFNIVGRKAGAEEGFKYSDALIKLGASGEVWTVDDIAKYVADPNKYTEEKVGDKSLKTKMTFKLASKQADIAAYLLKNSPDAPAN